MKIGRNEPCPCGSGLKYKKCCADRQTSDAPPGGTAAVMDEVHEQLKGRNFGSLEEANAFIAGYMQKRNQAPFEDFFGLSSDQMHCFLNFPFSSPDLITFPSCLNAPPQAPIMALFNLLVEGIGEKGLKPTATGNLPRDFCRQTARTYLGEERYQEYSRYGEIRSEPEFFDLHVTRLVAELAGLIRKYKGKFILGRECRALLADKGLAGIYPRLFRAFVEEYNWAYRDGWQEIPFIQHSFLFTLYLLKKQGAEWQTNRFYEDCFLRAFPQVVNDVEPVGEYYSSEDVLRISYSLRCLKGFLDFMGLAESEEDSERSICEGFRLRKRPLLDEVVRGL
ncbi:SEC-C metal-binding domain-containing protein [Geoalkalibacter halelectricus]|uniref:SEC-C domain-containing protein n=1 Tax=Geoalkalibacter halelectricus TaxID=2847045 RepID=A0ABY5ZR64_9BACT|nr:SEC-C metal-binding domain-containing protein [Geoalkalibacter halelectricus]UWZ79716.1 SEC-C domain-containing protein [Geoalkalibacter halelectricus]